MKLLLGVFAGFVEFVDESFEVFWQLNHFINFLVKFNFWKHILWVTSRQRKSIEILDACNARADKLISIEKFFASSFA
jgi:hypothetical protein